MGDEFDRGWAPAPQLPATYQLHTQKGGPVSSAVGNEREQANLRVTPRPALPETVFYSGGMNSKVLTALVMPQHRGGGASLG